MEAGRDTAGQVFRQASTGDVGHAMEGDSGLLEGLHQGAVQPGWGE